MSSMPDMFDDFVDFVRELMAAGDDVPWCEVYDAGEMNNGCCSYCMQLHHKDD